METKQPAPAPAPEKTEVFKCCGSCGAQVKEDPLEGEGLPCGH